MPDPSEIDRLQIICERLYCVPVRTDYRAESLLSSGHTGRAAAHMLWNANIKPEGFLWKASDGVLRQVNRRLAMYEVFCAATGLCWKSGHEVTRRAFPAFPILNAKC
jgi:hypothetical protein